jgi:hypothetical protein
MLQFRALSDSSLLFHILRTCLAVFLAIIAVVSQYSLCKVIHQQSSLRLQVVFTSRLVCVSYIRVAITSRLVFVPKLATSTRAAGIVFSLKKRSGWREWEDGVGLIRVGGLLSGYIYIYGHPHPMIYFWSSKSSAIMNGILCFAAYAQYFCIVCTFQLIIAFLKKKTQCFNDHVYFTKMHFLHSLEKDFNRINTLWTCWCI